MEKFKVSKSQFKNYNVYSIGYCQAQSLLNDLYPIAYSSSVNGWACDYYQIGNVYISTGYRPIGKDVDYEIVRAYEAKADALYNLPYDKAKAKRQKLLNQFIQRITESK